MNTFFWLPFPFVRFAIALIIGILAAIFFKHPIASPEIALFLFSVFYGLTVLLTKTVKRDIFHIGLGFIAFVILILTGYIRTSKTSEKSILTKEISKADFYQATNISETLEKDNYLKNVIRINKIRSKGQWTTTDIKIHFYQRKDSHSIYLQYGDQVLVKSRPKSIAPPSNPHEFNYKKYLEHQRVYYQDFVDGKMLSIMDHRSTHPVITTANLFREKIKAFLSEHINGKNEKTVAIALVLGTRNEIDTQLKDAYSAAGASHIMAISGLHVGIIYLILLRLLGFLKKSKPGRWIFLIVIISALWIYAMITGLSPSVTRAVTMFSFILIGENFTRQTNIYNTLAASAFFMLLYDPYLILSVGFQLSYLAVIGIVYFQTKIYRWFEFNHSILSRSWKLISVSLAVQLTTFPLTVMYFNQFPTYFIITNLIVIPLTTAILVSGFLLLSCSFSEFLTSLFSFLMEKLIEGMNSMVLWVQSLPLSTLNAIRLDTKQVFLLYTFIIIMVIFFRRKRISYAIALCVVSFFFSFSLIYRYHQQDQQLKLIFYDISNTCAIDFIKGFDHSLWLSWNKTIDFSKVNYAIRQNRIQLGLSTQDLDSLLISNNDSSLQKEYDLKHWGGKKVMIINKSMGNFKGNEHISIDFIVINNNAIKNFQNFINNFDFKKLILSNTNSTTYIEAWKKFSAKKQISIFPVSEKGALEIDF